MVDTLWELTKIIVLVILIITLIKTAIEEWFVKPIKRKKYTNIFLETMDKVAEEAQKEVKNKKTTKKATKKDSK